MGGREGINSPETRGSLESSIPAPAGAACEARGCMRNGKLVTPVCTGFTVLSLATEAMARQGTGTCQTTAPSTRQTLLPPPDPPSPPPPTHRNETSAQWTNTLCALQSISLATANASNSEDADTVTFISVCLGTGTVAMFAMGVESVRASQATLRVRKWGMKQRISNQTDKCLGRGQAVSSRWRLDHDPDPPPLCSQGFH